MNNRLVATLAWAMSLIDGAGGAFGQQTPAMPENPPKTWLTYHLAHPGPGGAMPGDPNCAIHYKGRYHLHYIYQSKGHSFAHVSSADMVHWRWHPTVLTPTVTGHGMFSGTAFLTKEGKPAIIYHGAGSGRNQIAFALDDNLDMWSKPIAVEPRDKTGKLAEKMRHWDPDCWIMDDAYYALGGGKNPTLAKSKDLENWEFLGEFFHPDFPKDLGVAEGEDVSCANIFKIGDKWMLLCISHGLGARYYLGKFKDEKFLPYHHALLNWARTELFAPESLLTPDGRRVMWSWCTPWVNSMQKAGRTRDFEVLRRGTLQVGVQSLPRELSLPEDGVLRMRPLRELENLRFDPKQKSKIIVRSDAMHLLEDISGDTMELKITFTAPLPEEFGVNLLCDEKGTNGFTIFSGKRSKTMTVGYVKLPFELEEGEGLTLRVFIDKNLIESFANDRQAAVAWHEYEPDNLHVSLFSRGGRLVVEKVEAWRLRSVYTRE